MLETYFFEKGQLIRELSLFLASGGGGGGLAKSIGEKKSAQPPSRIHGKKIAPPPP